MYHSSGKATCGGSLSLHVTSMFDLIQEIIHELIMSQFKHLIGVHPGDPSILGYMKSFVIRWINIDYSR